MFERTRPLGGPDLMRVSEFRRYLLDLAPAALLGAVDGSRQLDRPSQIGPLGPSLMADLKRRKHTDGHQPLEVIAACVRHGKRVTVHLQCGQFALPLCLNPPEQTIQCGLGLLDFLYAELNEVRLLWIEAAPSRSDAQQEAPSLSSASAATPLPLAAPAPPVAQETLPLGPVLWQLAMRGLQRELLADIAGPAVYRLAPGLDLSRLVLGNAEAAAVYRLRREAATLKAIADWPGFDRLRATFLLNALYLQAGLIVSRSHPRAIRESWFTALGAR